MKFLQRNYKHTNTDDYLPCDSTHPESCKENIPYNLTKIIIVFISNPEKVKLRLNELRILLKIINTMIILFQMLFTVLNSKVLHRKLKIMSTIYLLLHPSTKIQIMRL